ncbi:MAG: neutral zinc metallopeptidase [Planctomycetota bacterium]|jgi:predicted metalloprotease|nr:neutral zinc metallopeptidase [Planctomycetota bacterium]
MRWRDRQGSENVEDRRGRGGGRRGKLPLLGGGGGILMLVVALVAGYYGLDLTPLLTGSGSTVISTDGGGTAYQSSSPQEEEMARFSSVALKTTEEVWTKIFGDMGKSYRPPRLVLYSEVTDTACGYGEAAMGPFYCPGDQTVYLDLSFYRDMKQRLGGGGDFAQGYVLAHEVGHHIQNLMGIDREVSRRRRELSERDANRLSVLVELQADCYAGVWGRAMRDEGILDPGDLEQALKTAEAIGDDRLQRQSSGRVVPDSFTHGTSQQRYYWFKRGFDSGDPNQCNTFAEFREAGGW